MSHITVPMHYTKRGGAHLRVLFDVMLAEQVVKAVELRLDASAFQFESLVPSLRSSSTSF